MAHILAFLFTVVLVVLGALLVILTQSWRER